MKKLFLTLLCTCAAAGLRAQGNEWHDAAVNEINRQQMHATFFAYESADAARKGDPHASARFLDLDGTWKFSWVRNADQRPADFFRTDYDDRSWSTMPVPGLWELNGYGDPQYLNIGYAWREQFENNPPYVPIKENHVGSYRREIEIPASWSDKQVIARFGSVTSNIYLWVNGRFVGYSEDSKLECEFDITRFVKPGKNLFAFQVFRWCDGTYLEDQDFFRLSGVGRDCFLYARDKRHIADVRLDATLSENYTRGRLAVELALPAATRGCTAEVTLTDPDGKAVASETAKLFGTIARLMLDAGRVQPWSAEIPALYGVTVTLKDPAGKTIEIIPLHTGFREVKIEGGQLLVNGQPVLIKGANRHEMDPDGGYVVSEERMIEDIRILKENNFNAVRTCHYPDDARWYALCDRYGLYLVAEANLESHGMGYDEKTLAKNPAYAQAHLERNIRNVRRNINHPSVIVWSLGNEAGDGPNFDACYDWIKAYDPSRPVHYERAVYNNGGRNTDIVCPMYWDYDQCEKYLRNNPRKPLIQCEYAHAMGNSLGGFGEYWALIRQYPHYQGGFIWDFVDQSLRKTGKNGAMIYGYGGDWNPYDASDWNFCDNGLISPDRVPNPHMHEARYWQQPVWTTLGEDRRTLTVFNENFFRPLDNCYLRWTVLRDGDPVRSGIVADLRVAPQQTAAVVLPLAPETLPADGELLLNVEYRLCDAEPLLAPDHRVAYQQFTLRAAAPEPLAVAERMADRHNPIGTLTVRDDDRNYLIVESPAARIDFRRADGLITRYEADGMRLLDAGAVVEPNFWRAPIDNDCGSLMPMRYSQWKIASMYLSHKYPNGSHYPGLYAPEIEVHEDCAEVSYRYVMPTTPASECRLTYRVFGDGSIQTTLTYDPVKELGDMPEFGVMFKLDADYDHVTWYGMGPEETYVDRCAGAKLGVYKNKVEDNMAKYLVPQECGNKVGVRWATVTNRKGRGMMFSGDKMEFSALPYTPHELENAMHPYELPQVHYTVVRVAKQQMGVGGDDSWGAQTHPEYLIPIDKKLEFTFTFKGI